MYPDINIDTIIINKSAHFKEITITAKNGSYCKLTVKHNITPCAKFLNKSKYSVYIS